MSAMREGRESRRSSKPQAARVKVPSAPVREPLSTTLNSNTSNTGHVAARGQFRVSASQMLATIDQSSRLLK